MAWKDAGGDEGGGSSRLLVVEGNVYGEGGHADVTIGVSWGRVETGCSGEGVVVSGTACTGRGAASAIAAAVAWTCAMRQF